MTMTSTNDLNLLGEFIRDQSQDAFTALDETDRTAILLRFFENKSLREVGESLGTSDGTARKRVNRAVEHLREFSAKRGVTVGVVLISANAVVTAPAGLSAAIAVTALAGTTIFTAATATVGKANRHDYHTKDFNCCRARRCGRRGNLRSESSFNSARTSSNARTAAASAIG